MRPWLLLFIPVALCAQIDPQKLVDLTWSYDEKTIYWPTAKPFQFEKESWGISPGGYWYSAGRYSASEHGGTHLDSPIHFGKDQLSTDKIPLSRLVAPAVVIDVRKACDRHPDYLVTAADLTAWEKAHGAIPRGSIAVIHTGWGQFWPDHKRYLGTDKAGDVAGLHFPGIGRDAAELLKSRGVAGVGIDTASMDYGQSKDFITHQVLNGAGIYGLENIAYLEKVPAKGATFIALPMKIAGGSGGPVRLVALLP
jgi:kynurenine formamidase